MWESFEKEKATSKERIQTRQKKDMQGRSKLASLKPDRDSSSDTEQSSLIARSLHFYSMKNTPVFAPPLFFFANASLNI